MLIVSDTSPITNLIQIKQLDLLRKLFGQIVIPEKVFEELSDYERQTDVIKGSEWILVKTVSNQKAVKELSGHLDLGEAEAIVLAKELKANLLIVDERRGRNEAEKQGLEIIGLLGILVRGKQKGHLQKLKPILDQLIKEVGFRVSKKLYEFILNSVEELD